MKLKQALTVCIALLFFIQMHSQNDCDISLGGADGTFDSTTNPGWGNVGEGGWTNGLGTADTWDTPIPMDNPRGPGLPPSSQGGIVAGALDADSNTPTESFFADITGFVVGETYLVSFEQSHGGVDVNVLSTPTPIGALARWKVDLGPNSQFTPSMAFEGFGSQTWSTVSLTFVATDVTQRLTLTADKDGQVEGGAPYENVMIDNIVISTGASIDTGVSGTLDICGNDDALIDLFDIITEEEEGGVWSQTSGTGGVFDAGAGTFVPTAGETTTSVFTYTSCNGNETTATVNVNNPVADAPSDVTACDSYTLPPLTNGTYYDAPNGSGVLLNSGTVITETTTVYVYAETGTIPNCTIDNSFMVTISTTPVLNESDASCDSTNDTYSVTYTINDGNYDITVVPNTVVLDVATNTVSNIPLGTTVTITATSTDNENCTTTLSPVEPDCDCIISAPTTSDSIICEGDALPTFMATTNPGLSIRWLAQDGVTVLLENSTTFTPDITDVLIPGTTTFNVQAYDAVDSCFSTLVPFTLTIEASVSAGENNSVNVCDFSPTIDLFELLGDTASQGGTWSPVLSSGTGIFNPAIDLEGVYTYTVTATAPCLDDSAQVVVDIINLPNAGEDGTVTLCNNNDNIDLFDSLGGTPDMGGIWNPTLASGTGIFDPSIDPAGPYTYTVSSAGCGEATSEAIVTVNPAVNAGEDASLNICDNAGAVNLFELIGGNPDTGGTWTPGLASGTAIFDPALDAEGTYTYTVIAEAPCSNDFSQVAITFDNALLVIQPDDLSLCDDNNDASEAFDLEQQTPLITADNLNYGVSYHVSQQDADNNLNALNSPYTNINNPQTIYTRVVDRLTGCTDTTINFDIQLEQGVMVNSVVYELCDDNVESDNNPSNDSTFFELNTQNDLILNGQNPANHTVSYYLTNNDAQNDLNPLNSDYSNTSNPQTLFVRIENTTTSCYAIGEIQLVVNPLPIIDLEDRYTICIDSDGQVVLPTPTIDSGLDTNAYSFEWFLNGNVLPNQTNATIDPIQIGAYSVIATNSVTGCNSEATTIVVESTLPIVQAEQTSVTFIEDNVIFASASGSNSAFFEFKLDNGPWVSNEPNTNTFTFENVPAGEHTVTARDINGCGEDSITIILLDFIPYFTPNNDSFHDTWKILGLENQPEAKLYIFDRYGKLIKQLNPTGKGWDGTYNNNRMPTSDYWFKLDYIDPNTGSAKTFRSHFTLKR